MVEETLLDGDLVGVAGVDWKIDAGLVEGDAASQLAQFGAPGLQKALSVFHLSA